MDMRFAAVNQADQKGVMNNKSISFLAACPACFAVQGLDRDEKRDEGPNLMHKSGTMLHYMLLGVCCARWPAPVTGPDWGDCPIPVCWSKAPLPSSMAQLPVVMINHWLPALPATLTNKNIPHHGTRTGSPWV